MRAGIPVKKDLSSRLIVKRCSIQGYQEYKIQGYCNGLIALVQRLHNNNNIDDTITNLLFVVINPLTKECNELPPLKIKKLHRLGGQGLGFDNSTNTFKMVCVFEKNYRDNNVATVVHVLGTDSWREISQVPFYHICGEPAVSANGRLYWFARTSSSRVGSQLVWFDMKKEEFGVIDLPKKEEGSFSNTIVDLNGEVGFVFRIEGSDNRVVWRLKHGEEWMRHCVIHRRHCYAWIVLGCWNKDGDILIEEWMSSVPKSRLVVYRLKSRSFHSLTGPEDDPREEKQEVRMYQSSLLSSILKWH